MGDRMTVVALARDAYQYYQGKKAEFEKGGLAYTEEGIGGFIQRFINEPLPNKDISQMTDVGVVYKANPGWPLKKVKEYAQETVGLEEKFRYFQVYCQPPRGNGPIDLPLPERQLMCPYFADSWKGRFPITHHTMRPAAKIPLTQDFEAEDGDTPIECFQNPDGSKGECHVVRLAGIDTQESVDLNDVVTEVRRVDVESLPANWNVKGTYCHTSSVDGDARCVIHAMIPNDKMPKQTREAWSALIRIMEVKEPELAEKLKRERVGDAMLRAGILATKYRGKLAGMILQYINEYAKQSGDYLDAEPSFAVPDAWNDATKSDGRLEGVCYFGRLLLWNTLRKDKEIFLKLLMDDKYGLSAYSSGKLKPFYLLLREQIEKEMGGINFKGLGLSPDEIAKTNRLFLSLVVDPSKVFSKARTTELAGGWLKTSTYLDFYHYTDNLNMFLIYLGMGEDTTAKYPNIRGKTLRHLKKEAADEVRSEKGDIVKHRHGLFASPVFFMRYATKKQKDQWIEEIRGKKFEDIIN